MSAEPEAPQPASDAAPDQPDGVVREKGAEFVLPIVIGTCAFYLGKKATDTQTHRWNLYVRGANGEEITHVVKKVVFFLHPTFHNPVREVLQHPFEIEEHGWGEFELSVVLHFNDDVQEAPLELFHKLKLYADADSANQGSKKPVVNEQYEELVFSEPATAFLDRVNGFQAGPALPTPAIAPHFVSFEPAGDVRQLLRARNQVAAMAASLQRQYDQMA
ncbi:hypothetical protein WJX81_007486 [Elliptochloris bilobata]|uniref:YEATS domain-containing protein n=1 Tax=Elliptochloris bilobata TaxID=381761 RepID=A0AAW1S6H0_9CHLO